MKKSIIFDFDGVILDSLEAKTNAFKALYSQYGLKITKKVEAHHLQNGGMSRFLKIKHYHKEFLNLKLDKEEFNFLLQSFSKLVFNAVINSKFIPGVKIFLENNYENYNFFISTGTPTNEIIEILKKKNIFHYFKDVYGSPDNKKKHIEEIINKYKINYKDAFFIGDAKVDFLAASFYKILFILVTNKHNLSLQNKNIFCISDFKKFDINQVLEFYN